jgi:hypothetical protein
MKRSGVLLAMTVVFGLASAGVAAAGPSATTTAPGAATGEPRAVWHTDSYWPNYHQCEDAGRRIEHVVQAWTCVLDRDSPYEDLPVALRVLD